MNGLCIDFNRHQNKNRTAERNNYLRLKMTTNKLNNKNCFCFLNVYVCNFSSRFFRPTKGKNAARVVAVFQLLSGLSVFNIFQRLTPFSFIWGTRTGLIFDFSSLAAGYVELRDVFKLGIIIAIMNIVIWAVAGAGWWKVLGLY